MDAAQHFFNCYSTHCLFYTYSKNFKKFLMYFPITESAHLVHMCDIIDMFNKSDHNLSLSHIITPIELIIFNAVICFAVALPDP